VFVDTRKYLQNMQVFVEMGKSQINVQIPVTPLSRITFAAPGTAGCHRLNREILQILSSSVII